MWRTKRVSIGWRCENTRTWDTTDQVWSSESEAQAWADARNAAQAAKVAENKLIAAKKQLAKDALIAKIGPLADQRYIDPDAE